MSTPSEHMADDMAWTFAQDGEEVRNIVVNGTTRRGMTQDLETFPGEFEGGLRRRLGLSVLPGVIAPLPRTGYTMTVDGEEYVVESISSSSVLDTIIMVQYA